MFGFRRTTVFCLSYCLSKHKMPRYSKNFGCASPLGSSGYAYALHPKDSFKDDFLHQTNLFDERRVSLNTKFIKILYTQVTGGTTFT